MPHGIGLGGLAAADRTEQVEDLLAFLQPLGPMAEIGHHLFDRFFEPVEVPERGVDLDDLVAEDARQALVVPGVEQLRLANGHQHALRRGGIHQRIALAGIQVFLDRELIFTRLLVSGQEMTDGIHTTS